MDDTQVAVGRSRVADDNAGTEDEGVVTVQTRTPEIVFSREEPPIEPARPSVKIDLALMESMRRTISKLDPRLDTEGVEKKVEAFVQISIRDWLRWVNNENRDSRIDDMIVGRIGLIYADIIETVPSQEDIVNLFMLKPSLAKKVSELFTQSPTDEFKLRIYRALQDHFQQAIEGANGAIGIEINKNLDAILRHEEETLHKADPSFEHRSSGRPLFAGAATIKVAYDDVESGTKMIQHLDAQIQAIQAGENVGG